MMRADVGIRPYGEGMTMRADVGIRPYGEDFI